MYLAAHQPRTQRTDQSQMEGGGGGGRARRPVLRQGNGNGNGNDIGSGFVLFCSALL